MKKDPDRMAVLNLLINGPIPIVKMIYQAEAKRLERAAQLEAAEYRRLEEESACHWDEMGEALEDLRDERQKIMGRA